MVTVIVQEPAPTVVTTPELSTVATDVSLELQVTDLSSAFSGDTVATKVKVFPFSTVAVDLSKVTPVTFITVNGIFFSS